MHGNRDKINCAENFVAELNKQTSVVFTGVQSIVQAPTQKLVTELQNVFHFRQTKRSRGRAGGSGFVMY